MTKNKVVIASILKPIDDTRMYEKIGLSLAKVAKFDVNIIGFFVKDIPKKEQITFHPIFNFPRLSLKRLYAPVQFYCLIRKIKPSILIINTHELLFVGAIYSLFNRTRYIYDVRENYYRNIRYTATFPKVIRPFLATWVRSKEYLSRLFVNHYFLAEKDYEEEFSFSKGKSTVLENKYQPAYHPIKTSRNPLTNKLLFSGTLAHSTGVFQAIQLAIDLHTIDQSITLDIVGYSPLKLVIKNIISKIEGHDFITLHGGNELVNHQEVIAKIKSSNYGIIFYPYNKSTINSTPTKLYEYLANKLPLIIQDHPKWKIICEQNTAGIVMDFNTYSAESILHLMKSQKYYSNIENSSFLWHTEEVKLLKVLNHK